MPAPLPLAYVAGVRWDRWAWPEDEAPREARSAGLAAAGQAGAPCPHWLQVLQQMHCRLVCPGVLQLDHTPGACCRAIWMDRGAPAYGCILRL